VSGTQCLRTDQYHTSAQTHPAVYPLEADLDVDSTEFQNTIEGVTGMPFVLGNHVAIFNNGDEFYPAMLDAIESAERSITMENYIYWERWDAALRKRLLKRRAKGWKSSYCWMPTVRPHSARRSSVSSQPTDASSLGSVPFTGIRCTALTGATIANHRRPHCVHRRRGTR
jgi:hypothetical protein